MKMYICVRDDFPDYMVPTLVGHAVLRHHLIEMQQDHTNGLTDCETYMRWLNESFKKCVVRVNMKEFKKIQQLPNIVESWENKTLNGEVACLTVITGNEIPNVLKFAKLWAPCYEST